MKFSMKKNMGKLGLVAVAGALMVFGTMGQANATDLGDFRDFMSKHPWFQLQSYDAVAWTHDEMEAANELEPILENENGEPPLTDSSLKSYDAVTWTHDQMVAGEQVARKDVKEK